MNKDIQEFKCGSMRAREIQAQIKNLSSIEERSGYEFNRLRERLQNIGTSDYAMKKAIIYRENYMTMIKNYQSYDNYDKLIAVLDKYKNPASFYEFVSQNELLSDITYMYDMSMNMGVGTVNEQASFNRMLESIGVILES